jgi:hypothetical protein
VANAVFFEDNVINSPFFEAIAKGKASLPSAHNHDRVMLHSV